MFEYSIGVSLGASANLMLISSSVLVSISSLLTPAMDNREVREVGPVLGKYMTS
tara:strand:+ start:340 stop:501 length:162 start_codon:yes stop_codon:yes gene_type:complete